MSEIEIPDNYDFKKSARRLGKLYEQAKKAPTTKDFFFAVYEYVAYIKADFGLNFIIIEFVQLKREQDRGELVKLEEQVRKELEKANKELRTYVLKNNIKDPGIEENFENFQAAIDGRLESSLGLIGSMHSDVTDTLFDLYREKEKHKQFLEKNGRFDKDFQLRDWTIVPTWKKLDDEKRRLELIEQTRPWYLWDHLEFIYNLIAKHQDMHNELSKSTGRGLSMMGFGMAMSELLRLVRDEKIDQPHYFNEQEYRTWLGKFHFQVEDCIDEVMKQAGFDVKPATNTTSNSEVRVTLSLVGKKLKVHLPNDQIVIKTFRSKDADNFKACKALLQSIGQPLTKKQMNYTGSTPLKDIPKSMGLVGIYRDKFIEYDPSSKTLTLRKTAIFTGQELADLTKAVNKASGDSSGSQRISTG